MAGNLVKKVMLKIVADDGDSQAKLDAITAKADELGRLHPDIKVKVDSAAASAKLAVLRKELKDTGSAASQPHKFSLSGLVPAIGQMGLAQKLMLGLNAATTFAEPLLAGVGVAAGGLASSLAAAGGGLAVFGAVAKANFMTASTAANAVQTAQIAYNAAIKSGTAHATAYAAEQKAISIAYAQLSPAQIALSKSIGAAQNQWQSFVQSNTGGVSKILNQGIGLLPKLFRDMQPVMAPVESALHGIIADLGKSLQSGGLKTMFDWIAKNTGPAITGLAHAIGNIAVGLGGILRAFTPVQHGILHGLDDITAKFARWGTTLGSHTGFQSMMTMFKTETPLAVHALGQLGGIIKTVIADMTGLSGPGNSKMLLQLANPVLALTNALLKANPDLVRLALYLVAAGSAGKKLGAVFGKDSGFANLITGVKTGVSGLKDFKAGFTDAGQAASAGTGMMGTFGGSVSAAVTAVKGWSIWSNIASGATKVWTGVQAAFDAVMDANPIALVVLAVVALIGVVVLMITHMHETMHIFDLVRHAGAVAFDDVRHAIAAAFGWVKSHWPLLLEILTGPFGLAVVFVKDHWKEISHAVGDVIDWVKGHWPLLLAILTGPIGLAVLYIVDHWHQILTGAESMVHDVTSWFTRLPGMILHAVGNLGHLLWSAGVAVVQGLIGGIASMGGALVSAGEHLAGSLMHSVGNFLGIGSPSKLAHWHGEMIGQGLIGGMDSMHGRVTAAATRLGRAATPGGYGSYGGGAGAGQKITLEFTGGGGSELERAIWELVKHNVRVKGGGGTNSVQRALGQTS